ncbi:MAG: hypothetical protein V4510_12780 [bacterium]
MSQRDEDVVALACEYADNMDPLGGGAEQSLARLSSRLEAAEAENKRLRDGRWTDEERKLFLYEATKASYAEGTRAGCEKLSIAAAEMSEEIEGLTSRLEADEGALRELARAVEAENRDVVMACGRERTGVTLSTWDGAVNEYDDVFRAKNLVHRKSMAVEHALNTTRAALAASPSTYPCRCETWNYAAAGHAPSHSPTCEYFVPEPDDPEGYPC